ncbi:MAG: repressor LexA [Bryobacterales bacterium]|nr:repressor LexA [Bryobacterales bacterium]
MLTPRQQSIFDFIVSYRRRHGCSPSIPEIQRHFGIRSPNGVAGHLDALKNKGYIRKGERGSRRIDLNRAETTELPVQGEIAAGYPQATAAGPPEQYISVDESALGFRPKEGSFALRVRGDSMRDAGILPGDLVVIEPAPTPKENQIVAALIDGESTLKRLVRVSGKWFLKAENPAYPELHPRSDLVIQGAVRALIRRLN